MNKINSCLKIISLLFNDFESLDYLDQILISVSGFVLKDTKQYFEEEGPHMLLWLIW